jgi:hypothetical protein
VKYLYYRTHLAGLSNQRMSLDVAVGMAHLTGRALVEHRGRLNRRPRREPRPKDRARAAADVVAAAAAELGEPSILDLFDVPVPVLGEADFLRNYHDYDIRYYNRSDIPKLVFHHPADLDVSTEDARLFARGRRQFFSVDERANEADVLQFFGLNFGMYSYTFYLPPELRSAFLERMARIRPRRELTALAAKLAAHFGRFNAIHVRRGDLYTCSPRSAVAGPLEMLENMRRVLPERELLLILTDEPDNHAFFDPIRAVYKNYVMLDAYVRDDAEWRAAFAGLPGAGGAARALVSQLVAVHAETFVGTMHSTFTAMIQRMRGVTGGDRRFLFLYNQFLDRGPELRDCEIVEVRGGPYSWIRADYPESPENHAWFREWPEVFAHLSDRAVPREDALVV